MECVWVLRQFRQQLCIWGSTNFFSINFVPPLQSSSGAPAGKPNIHVSESYVYYNYVTKDQFKSQTTKQIQNN